MKNQQIISSKTKQEDIDEFESTVRTGIKSFFNGYMNFVKRRGGQPLLLTENSTCWQIYLKWHQYFIEKRDTEDFGGIEHRPKSQEDREYASEIDFFKRSQIIRDQTWEVRISNKANNKIRFSPFQNDIIRAILGLQRGYMSDSELLETGPILYLAGFAKKIVSNQTLVYAIVPQRVPIIAGGSIYSYYYSQYLRIIDIVQTSDVKQKHEAFSNFQYYFQDDPDKWNAFQPTNFLDAHPDKIRTDREYLDINNIVIIHQGLQRGYIYQPALNFKHELTPSERKAYQYTHGRWVSEEESSKLSWQVTTNIKKQNRDLIASCTNQASCEWLLKFLQKIPNLKLNLTREEEILISTPGNILCLGRSGTGKTTSAVLRLFALEILFKIRSSLLSKDEQSLKGTKVTSEEVSNATGLHSVIVTASPVLTNEIRRYYDSMKDKIINELKRREAIRKQREENKANPSADNIESSEPTKEEVKQDEVKKVADQGEEDIEINDEMMDADEIEKSLNIPQSIREMQNKNFPAFLSVKRLVYMIDASLSKPFFARNLQNKIIGMDTQAEWHNEQKGILMINNYYKNMSNSSNNQVAKDSIDNFVDLSSSDEEDDDNDRPEIIKGSKQATVSGDSVVQEFAQEIDFETFDKKFWPKNSQRYRQLQSSTVWTEIFSVIKGSANSHKFVENGISREQYMSTSLKKTFLSDDERSLIYDIYHQYELWKKYAKGFDFMDLVNYLLREISAHRYYGAPIHFMMVDEVQDLTAATIMLLVNVTEQNLYFAGDTAQTIAKGVGFRFSDLKSILHGNPNFSLPQVLQLTVNFRSHNQILHLANSIIVAIELLFPSTIDKLRKERSQVDGLKPIVLDSDLLESLFFVLTGQQKSKESLGTDALGKDKAEFGCDQVIIVRDQEAKQKVPAMLQHALCLTVYEAKGLEFDDVILYNFFTNSQCLEQWNVINDIEFSLLNKKKEDKKAKLQNLDELEIDEEAQNQNNLEGNDEKFNVNYGTDRQFYLKHVRINTQKEYNKLCNELKQLYVCVTRPRKRLIIYDEQPDAREIMLKYWQRLDAVEVITEQMIKSLQEDHLYKTQEQKALYEALQSGFSQAKSEDNKKGWRVQGINMLQRRFYEQAYKCFEHSGDTILQQRALGYKYAEDAAKSQGESETIAYRLDDQSQKLSKQEKRQIKLERIQKQNQAILQFKKAADIFIGINLKKQAAQCLYTAQEYEKAAQLFEEVGLLAQAGEAYYNLKNYPKAAQLYNEGKLVAKAIECYKKQKNWDAILNCIKSNKNEFTQQQREELIYKYVPLALNSLYVIMTNDNADGADVDQDEDDKNDEANEMKQDIKGVRNSQVIQEDSDDDEEDENDNSEEESAHSINSENDTNQEEESDQISILDESEATHKDQSLVQIDTTSNQSPHSSKKIKQNKQKLNQSDDFSIISKQEALQQESNNESLMDQFEHLSQFDLEDEFIKSRSVSIIDSIISGRYKESSSRSELSAYSVIEMSEENPAMDQIMQTVNVIRTKRDIYAEDQMMTKIIYYVSQFSQDVRSHLASLRSKDALLSTQQQDVSSLQEAKIDQMEQINTNSNDNDGMDYLDIDIDNIDDQFIDILLDCLESFELYKLCLLVCNRYHLKEKIGRYLVSIAYKYSNTFQMRQNFVLFFHKPHKEIQQQVSFIAHLAFHGALELVDPKYIQIQHYNKIVFEGQVANQYCNTALLNLGFWKKIIYMMDVKSCLSVASAFGDYQNAKLIYLGFYKSQDSESANKNKIALMASQSNFEFLGTKKYPQDEIQTMAFKFALDSVVSEYSNNPTLPINFAFPPCFQMSEIALKLQRSRNQMELDYLITSLNNRIISIYNHKPLSALIKDEIGVASNKSFVEELYIYDAFVAVFILVQNAFKDKPSAHTNLLSLLNETQYLLMLKVLQLTLLILQSKDLKLKYESRYSTMIMGMLSVLNIRQIQPCDGIYDNIGDKVIVHYTSTLAMELTQLIDTRKKEIAEKVTLQVYESDQAKFSSKGDLQKLFKKTLREELQKESLESQIEVADLDANFLKVPVNMVIDKLLPKLEGYIRRGASSKLKQPLAAESNYFNIFDTPFQCEELLDKIISTYQSSLQASKIFYDPKEILGLVFKEQEDMIRHEIQGSVQYYTIQENKNKESRIQEHQQWLVKIGLLTPQYLERKNKKQAKLQDSANFLLDNQKKSLQSMSKLAFLNFKPLQSKSVDRSKTQEIAQKYWQLFMSTMQGNGNQCNLEYAMLSLSLFIITDDYLQFMEMIQNSLKQGTPERLVVFKLLDIHVYKQCGDLLSASQSILDFLSMIKKYDFTLDIYYKIVLIHQAIALTLSATTDSTFYLPFQYTQYLCHYFNDLDNSDLNTFYDILSDYNKGNYVQLNLKLKNCRFSQNKTKSTQIISNLIKEVHHILTVVTDQSVIWQLYEVLITLILNDPDAADQNKNKIQDCFQQFAQDDVIGYDSPYFEYQSYHDMRNEFEGLEIDDQNSFISVPQKGEDSQSIFVRIDVRSEKTAEGLKKHVEDTLAVAEITEAEKLQMRKKVAIMIQPYVTKAKGKKANLIKKQQMAKYDKKCLPMNRQFILNSLNIQESQYNENINALVDIYLGCQNLVRFINQVAVNSTYNSVVDLHYLLQQKDKIQHQMIDKIGNAIRDGTLISKEEIQEIHNKGKQIKDQVAGWSLVNYDTSGHSKMIEKNQKIMKLKWKEHALMAKQKAMAKVARRKKLEAVERKKARN